MWWNAVKSCQISPIYLSFHHKLVAITSLPHPTAKHEARQCTSLNLRVLLQNHLDRPWPATSWSWCKPMKWLKGYDWWELCFFDLLWFWPEGRKLRGISPKIWNCQIWSSGDFQANLGFQKVIPYFSPPTCHDRSTPNGSSAGSWSQSSQTPKRIQPISSYIDILYDYFCPCSVKPQKNELDSVKLHKFWGAENLLKKKHG